LKFRILAIFWQGEQTILMPQTFKNRHERHMIFLRLGNHFSHLALCDGAAGAPDLRA